MPSRLLIAILGVACLWRSTTAPVVATQLPVVVTFSQQVEPILRRHCTTCHRTGGPAPFALATFEDVVDRAQLIRHVVNAGLMPPWLPAEGAETFAGARRLTRDEHDILRRWLDEGMKRGAITPRPNPPTAHDGLGTPDLVVEAPAGYVLPAEGPDVFRSFVLPSGLSARRWVQAVVIDPGSTSATHHAALGIDRSRTSRRFDAQSPDPGFAGMLAGGAASPPGHFIGWAPGRSLYRSPEGMAWSLEAGADLVLQMHLVPNGEAVVVRPRIHLYFTNQPPRERPVLVRLGSTSIDLPAGVPRHVVRDTFELPVEVAVVGIAPHAHYLATALSARVVHGDQLRALISIPRWNVRWQDDYRYVTPVLLPAGARVTAEFTYDNSAANPTNPHHPPRRVVYGPGVGHEMGDVWLQVTTRSPRERSRLERQLAERELLAQTRGYERLIASGDNDPTLRLTLATLYLSAARLDAAIDVLGRVLREQPAFPLAHYTRGVALQRAGRLTEAARDFHAALALDAQYAEAEHALGHVRRLQGATAEAARHFTQAVTLWPEFADAWNSLAVLDGSRGATAAAEESYRQAIAASPDHREALNNLGILLAGHGRIAEAIEVLTRAVAAHPDDPASQQNLAAALAARR